MRGVKNRVRAGIATFLQDQTAKVTVTVILMIVSSPLITDLWKFMFSTIQSRGAWKSSLCFKRLGILFRWLCRHSLIHNSGFPSAWFLTQLLFRSNLWPMRVDFGSKKSEKRHFFKKTWMLVVWSYHNKHSLPHLCHDDDDDLHHCHAHAFDPLPLGFPGVTPPNSIFFIVDFPSPLTACNLWKPTCNQWNPPPLPKSCVSSLHPD